MLDAPAPNGSWELRVTDSQPHGASQRRGKPMQSKQRGQERWCGSFLLLHRVNVPLGRDEAQQARARSLGASAETSLDRLGPSWSVLVLSLAQKKRSRTRHEQARIWSLLCSSSSSSTRDSARAWPIVSLGIDTLGRGDIVAGDKRKKNMHAGQTHRVSHSEKALIVDNTLLNRHRQRWLRQNSGVECRDWRRRWHGNHGRGDGDLFVVDLLRLARHNFRLFALISGGLKATEAAAAVLGGGDWRSGAAGD